MRTDQIKQFIVLIISCLFLYSCQQKQPVNYLEESDEDFDDRMEWWRDAGFGMFIHWGAYAVPAGIYKGEEIPGIGEWIMNTAQIPVAEYEEYVKQFNPEDFYAEEWVRIAKNAGMKYIVITSKHHDGFCLWISDVTEYDIMDFAPFKRDILKELSEACGKEGIRLCFYHSIMDWHHPDATGENFAKYREEYLKPQVKELVTEYGDIGVMWFDGEWEQLPDFSQLNPVRKGYVYNIGLHPVHPRENYFGIVFKGQIQIKEPGEYTFYTESDDGSRLYINGEIIVENDGLHGMEEKAGNLSLAKGIHEFGVDYFEAGGGNALRVSMEGPGMKKQTIPNELLKHN